jgi:hypothetical protein
VILEYIYPDEPKRREYEYAEELKDRNKKFDWKIEDFEFEELEASYRNWFAKSKK